MCIICMCVYIFIRVYTYALLCMQIHTTSACGVLCQDTTITTWFGHWWLGWVPAGQHTPLSAGDGLLLLFRGSRCYEGLQDQNGSKGRIKKPDGDAEHYYPFPFHRQRNWRGNRRSMTWPGVKLPSLPIQLWVRLAGLWAKLGVHDSQ